MEGENHGSRGSTGRTNSDTSRRDLLRSTAGLAVGTGSAGVFSSAATAQLGGSGSGCSGSDAWLSAPVDYPVLDLRESTPSRIGDWPENPDSLSFFAHGLGGDSNEGWKRQAYTFESAARDNGWDPTMIAVLYNTGNGIDPSTGVQSAQTAGGRLASWVRSYDSQNDVSAYHAFSHSLGGHVVATLLTELGGDVVLDGVATMGPAIPANSVCQDGQYAAGITRSVGEFHNYRSSNDSVICGIYSAPIVGEGNPGLGCEAPGCGWSGSTPANFSDHDVSETVSGHCAYLKADVGCVPQILSDLDLDDSGGSGGTGSGSGGESGDSGGWWGSGGSGGSSGGSGGWFGSSGSGSDGGSSDGSGFW